MQTISELVDWVRQVEPSFAFLMGLPVLVAVAGLAAEALRRRSRTPARRTSRAPGPGMPGRPAQVR